MNNRFRRGEKERQATREHHLYIIVEVVLQNVFDILGIGDHIHCARCKELVEGKEHSDRRLSRFSDRLLNICHQFLEESVAIFEEQSHDRQVSVISFWWQQPGEQRRDNDSSDTLSLLQLGETPRRRRFQAKG